MWLATPTFSNMAAVPSFRPEEILRSVHAKVCVQLSRSEDSFMQFTVKLYEKGIIDMSTKTSVRRTKGFEGADILLDYLEARLRDKPDLFDAVISIMREVELLESIAEELHEKSNSGVVSGGTVQNSNGGTSANNSRGPRMKPSKILKKHMSSLLDIVSDPGRLATDCYNNELISKSTMDDVQTTTGLSRYQKASRIVNDFQRQLEVYDEEDLMIKFCGILKTQGDGKLERKAKEMLFDL